MSTQTQYQQWRQSSSLNSQNMAFIEDLYEDYLKDAESIPKQWQQYFADFALDSHSDISHRAIQQTFKLLTAEKKSWYKTDHTKDCLPPEAAEKQAAVLRLINAYRVRGHQLANIDPLNLKQHPEVSDLDPEFHGLGTGAMAMIFNTGSLFAPDRLPLQQIVDHLQKTYCGSVGSEYMYLTDTSQKRWIQKRLEESQLQANFDTETKYWILQLLTAAEGIERYLHTRYVGQKRFSLEGGESFIPLLDELIQQAGANGIQEIGLGMAHRGRLNVLINILGKSPSLLFKEFEGKHPILGSGDVKYHQGFSSNVETPGGPVHLALAFNPSHLEIVAPVVQGSVRARQQRRHDKQARQVLPILIHGDAAFAGQGVVMETFNMSHTRGFTTGGTVHIIINNQIGFTTNPIDSRSTLYCTEVAKMVQAPIFHVNGDDPEAVIFVSRIALDYCMTFRNDVIIDLTCYRRHGHNEADEPAVTQPIMYQAIRQHPTTRQIYVQQLIKEGIISQEDSEQMIQAYESALDQGKIVSRPILENFKHRYHADWTPYFEQSWQQTCHTAIRLETAQQLSQRLWHIPKGFELHARVRKLLSDRREMLAGDLPVDWGCAEILAYASLLIQGYPIRLSGQDSGRGTFFHRHAVLHNQLNGERYIPLQYLDPNQANFLVIDSLLSEEAVLAFEYGYSSAEPNGLTLWEAQFGDFANGAQVVIDQFITSGESKWNRLCGLVMLLPHGYEGQGAEHSSARLERYLQLCAEQNIQICIPSTPAQVFHMIRRQMLRPYRKPLIVMTAKSLLRHKSCVSSLTELTQGEFQTMIDETHLTNIDDIEKLIFCSGKVYYDLMKERQTLKANNVAIVRIEQLYPFPKEQLKQQIHKYPNLELLIWCQEEPQNQGAWDHIKHRFRPYIMQGIPLGYAGRPVSASPAVGSYSLHIQQQQQLVYNALTGNVKTIQLERCRNEH